MGRQLGKIAEMIYGGEVEGTAISVCLPLAVSVAQLVSAGVFERFPRKK
jgi:hypothetical protein